MPHPPQGIAKRSAGIPVTGCRKIAMIMVRQRFARHTRRLHTGTKHSLPQSNPMITEPSVTGIGDDIIMLDANSADAFNVHARFERDDVTGQ
ncbi:MAG: hypothetical protein ACI8P0_005098, partial [Planctomycetaceae bacterium]